MNQFNQKNLYYAYWQIARAVKSLGILGLIGIAISLLSILVYLLTIMPLQEKLSEATNQFEHSKKATLHSAVPAMEVAPQNTATEAKEFYAMLPNGASLPYWLAVIDKAAIKQGLILNRGDYKLSQIKTNTAKNTMSRYEIVLPVVGKYTQLRPFINQVLQQQPALGLADMQIRRENTLTPLVEAKLVFVLFVKGDAW